LQRHSPPRGSVARPNHSSSSAGCNKCQIHTYIHILYVAQVKSKSEALDGAGPRKLTPPYAER